MYLIIICHTSSGLSFSSRPGAGILFFCAAGFFFRRTSLLLFTDSSFGFATIVFNGQRVDRSLKRAIESVIDRVNGGQIWLPVIDFFFFFCVCIY